MKVLFCNITFAIEMSTNEFLKFDALNDDFELINRIENKFNSVISVEWDWMTGPYVYITIDNKKDIPAIVECIKSWIGA